MQLWWVAIIVNALSYPVTLRDFSKFNVRFVMGNSDVLHLGWDSRNQHFKQVPSLFLRQITHSLWNLSHTPFLFLFYSIISNLIFLVNVHASGTHLLPHALGAMCVVLGDRDRWLMHWFQHIHGGEVRRTDSSVNPRWSDERRLKLWRGPLCQIVSPTTWLPGLMLTRQEG